MLINSIYSTLLFNLILKQFDITSPDDVDNLRVIRLVNKECQQIVDHIFRTYNLYFKILKNNYNIKNKFKIAMRLKDLNLCIYLMNWKIKLPKFYKKYYQYSIKIRFYQFTEYLETFSFEIFNYLNIIAKYSDPDYFDLRIKALSLNENNYFNIFYACCLNENIENIKYGYNLIKTMEFDQQIVFDCIIRLGCYHAYEFLSETFKDIKIKDEHFVEACSSNNLDLVKKLYNTCSSHVILNDLYIIFYFNKNPDILKFLFEKNPIFIEQIKKCTGVLHSTRYKSIDSNKFVMDYYQIYDKEKLTNLLHQAIEYKKIKLIKYILSKNIKYSDIPILSISLLINNNNFKVLKYLINTYPEVLEKLQNKSLLNLEYTNLKNYKFMITHIKNIKFSSNTVLYLYRINNLIFIKMLYQNNPKLFMNKVFKNIDKFNINNKTDVFIKSLISV